MGGITLKDIEGDVDVFTLPDPLGLDGFDPGRVRAVTSPAR